MLRAKRKKGRRAKLPKERASLYIKVDETLEDGKLGLGLDDADEDSRGVVVVEVAKKSRKWGWEEGDRIIEVNGQEIDEFDDFKRLWDLARRFGTNAVFGIMRRGVVRPPTPEV